MHPPSTILAGALWAHFAFIAILALGGVLLVRGRLYRLWTSDGPTYESLPWVCLFFGLAGFGSLTFSDVATTSWARLLGHLSIPAVPLVIAVPLTLVGDLCAITYVVWLTGGSRHSPFKVTCPRFPYSSGLETPG